MERKEEGPRTGKRRDLFFTMGCRAPLVSAEGKTISVIIGQLAAF